MEDLKVLPPVTVIPTGSVASKITGDYALESDFVEQEESSITDLPENESTKWTNEKHSLYLKLIEASFVDQLYNSLDMLTCQTQNNHPDSQFKVLRCGCSSKKSFKRQHLHLKDADRPHVSPGNPWIQPFRNGSLKRLGSTATSLQYPVPNPVSTCSNTEVMDQNFEDTSCYRKRVRASKSCDSSNDQVVPHCTSAATEIPNSHVSSKKLVRFGNAGCDLKWMTVLKAHNQCIE
ncbi:hypothetical protein E3N88_45971 [Mikania micrantha]|uniref:Uncharacterized protein n=1 Tax=Mikania micrantha TaxID=192012 RepID=A0A5N6L7J9_9ASTR|nr:hypothetical protein E3N88_45971 [Mikania micrantha]